MIYGNLSIIENDEFFSVVDLTTHEIVRYSKDLCKIYEGPLFEERNTTPIARLHIRNTLKAAGVQKEE